jgi:ABC-type transporter Mla subunit MlaD
MAIRLYVTVQADAATASCLEELRAAIARLERNQEAMMTTLQQLLDLIKLVDDRTSEFGARTGAIATTVGAISETMAKLVLAVSEVGSDLQRLRDSLGGEGGLKPGEADQVRSQLEALVVKVEPVGQALDQASTALASQHVALESQAALLEQFGKDETLLPPAEPVDPLPPPEPLPALTDPPPAESSGT